MIKEDKTASAMKRKHKKISDYQITFSNEHGKRVLHDLMQFTGMLSSNFASDPYKTAFNEGQRNVLIKILSELNTDAALLQNSIKEIMDERRNHTEYSGFNT